MLSTGLRVWLIAVYGFVVVGAVLGLLRGDFGPGLFWGGLALVALLTELARPRSLQGQTLRGLVVPALLFNLLLVAGAVTLIVNAVIAPTAEERRPFIGMAILITPLAAGMTWASVAGYRRIQRRRAETDPPRPAEEVWAELRREASDAAPPDPQRELRQRRVRTFLGIAMAGWMVSVVVRNLGAEADGAVVGLLAVASLLLMLGGALAAGWATVWVFRERSKGRSAD